MQNSLALSILLLAFFASITFNGFFRNIAKKYKLLIDIPDKSRKFHFRATPQTGGIGIFFGILITGLLVTGLTDARYQIDFNNKGFLENSVLNDGSISKNFQVDDRDYSLSINNNAETNKVSVKIDQINETIDIVPLTSNKFKVILPDGSDRLYISEAGKVVQISNETGGIVDVFSPINTDSDRININNFSISLYLCALLIMIFMFFDDYFGIRASFRLLFQIAIVCLMIFLSEEYLSNLGNIFGSGEINLGILSIPFTVFCVVGLMNAYNMIDGLNGICAVFAVIPIIFVTYFGNFSYGLLIPIGAILGFLAYNLGFLGKQRGVFLGDSGSNMLGFAIAFICIQYSQDSNHSSYINPVTSLWLVAIPILDCITVVSSRVLKGIMPFRPGRDHLHHKLLDIGIKPKKILLIFIFMSFAFSFVGYYFEANFPNKEYISFYAFLIFSIFYYLISKQKLGANV
tara:strand:- start:568 stop:1947 length:1380 start_codon:yes stop_codon:yes gene_type:complete